VESDMGTAGKDSRRTGKQETPLRKNKVEGSGRVLQPRFPGESKVGGEKKTFTRGTPTSKAHEGRHRPTLCEVNIRESQDQVLIPKGKGGGKENKEDQNRPAQGAEGKGRGAKPAEEGEAGEGNAHGEGGKSNLHTSGTLPQKNWKGKFKETGFQKTYLRGFGEKGDPK